jgi:hypothetical protein
MSNDKDRELEALLGNVEPDGEMPPETVRMIIENRRQMWQQAIIVAKIDFQVAAKLGDEAMKNQLKEQAKRALQALEVLRALEAELG